MRNDKTFGKRGHVPVQVKPPPSLAAIGEAFLIAARSGVFNITPYAVRSILNEARAIDEREAASN